MTLENNLHNMLYRSSPSYLLGNRQPLLHTEALVQQAVRMYVDLWNTSTAVGQEDSSMKWATMHNTYATMPYFNKRQ